MSSESDVRRGPLLRFHNSVTVLTFNSGDIACPAYPNRKEIRRLCQVYNFKCADFMAF